MAKRTRTFVNKKNLLKEINTGANGKITKTLVANAFRSNVVRGQKEMLREFESHPVTQEIAAGPGPRGNNPSGTLSGYGDLWSFIGFEKDADPLGPVREILSRPIRYSIIKLNLFGFYYVSFDIPDKKEILNETRIIPWNPGRSWVDGIEQGISGLGNYLNLSKENDKSVSGYGFQIDKKLRGTKFKNTKYISQILKNLRRNIREGV